MTLRYREIQASFSKAIDLLIVASSFIGTYFIKRHLPFESITGLATGPNYYLLLLLLMVCCYITFRISGFYLPNYHEKHLAVLGRVVQGVLLGVVSFLLVLYSVHLADLSRLFVAILTLMMIGLLYLKALAVKSYLEQKGHRSEGHNVLVVGSHGRSQETIRMILKAPVRDFHVVGCLEIDGGDLGHEVYGGVKVIGVMDDFRLILYDQVIDDVIFALPLKKIDNAAEYIAIASEVGVNIRIMPDWQIQKVMYQNASADIVFEQMMGLPTLTLSSTPRQTTQLFIKEAMDYLGAAVGLVVLSPLFLLIALAIKLTSRGPVFFSQERSGLNGRKFMVYKFRTMVGNAEDILKDLVGSNEQDGPVFKIRKDPRVTWLGRFLRKSSMDELPQLFNVLKGEMSLVGPRPPIPAEVEKYEPWQRRRLSMKPGLTCIWQVSGRNDTSFDKWMRMDLEYIDSWTLLLDLKILLRTVKTVLSFTGH